ncbi:hypothetical protein [Nonomuraea sp. NPDC001699]
MIVHDSELDHCPAFIGVVISIHSLPTGHRDQEIGTSSSPFSWHFILGAGRAGDAVIRGTSHPGQAAEEPVLLEDVRPLNRPREARYEQGGLLVQCCADAVLHLTS